MEPSESAGAKGVSVRDPLPVSGQSKKGLSLSDADALLAFATDLYELVNSDLDPGFDEETYACSGLAIQGAALVKAERRKRKRNQSARWRRRARRAA